MNPAAELQFFPVFSAESEFLLCLHSRFSPDKPSPPAWCLLLSTPPHSAAGLCRGACVEVDSDTEAVANEGFKLGCISCKMRAEVPAKAVVTWGFRGADDQEGSVLDPRFEERLDWNGSKNTEDLQDGSIYILNVTFNDTGTYECTFRRTLIYTNYNFENSTTKQIRLRVVPKRKNRDVQPAAELQPEILVQIQILIQIQICFSPSLCPCRAEYLAVASESKENCGAVQEAE
uniref:Sodium channel regulatory subunit beta-3 n=1 Tax=Poecilia reticulata TaxID=8081 RepID=A0A3P9PRA6_POERE